MHKILVEVYVPALGASWDMFIPEQLRLYEVLEMMKKAVSDLSEGRFQADDSTVICHRESGKIININLSVGELGLRNASKLMLI